ncbi:hypothetical protein HT594_00008 [Phenacoccus solenopsis nudivirus]|nr:hypothetical protein HT594_00008 [Phenacoccus solenopsis nudivirus]
MSSSTSSSYVKTSEFERVYFLRFYTEHRTATTNRLPRLLVSLSLYRVAENVPRVNFVYTSTKTRSTIQLDRLPVTRLRKFDITIEEEHDEITDTDITTNAFHTMNRLIGAFFNDRIVTPICEKHNRLDCACGFIYPIVPGEYMIVVPNHVCCLFSADCNNTTFNRWFLQHNTDNNDASLFDDHRMSMFERFVLEHWSSQTLPSLYNCSNTFKNLRYDIDTSLVDLINTFELELENIFSYYKQQQQNLPPQKRNHFCNIFSKFNIVVESESDDDDDAKENNDNNIVNLRLCAKYDV